MSATISFVTLRAFRMSAITELRLREINRDSLDAVKGEEDFGPAYALVHRRGGTQFDEPDFEARARSDKDAGFGKIVVGVVQLVVRLDEGAFRVDVGCQFEACVCVATYRARWQVSVVGFWPEHAQRTDVQRGLGLAKPCRNACRASEQQERKRHQPE